MNGSFVLGVGAQKGGTTWLHDYLAAFAECEFGYRKEYHVFDLLDRDDQEWLRSSIDQKALRAADRASRGLPTRTDQLHMLLMRADTRFYYDYFAGLLARSEAVRVTGDFTPSYSMLGAERYADIAARFAERNIRTTAVLLMRDPVDRIVSQLRMQVDRSPAGSDVDVVALLRRRFREPQYQVRSRYDLTLAGLEAVFARDDYYVGLYETLFTERETRKICATLDLPYRVPDFDARPNRSSTTYDGVPSELLAEVAQSLTPAYSAAARVLGEEAVTASWPSSAYVW